MSDHTPSDELLARYFAGEGTAAERVAVEDWAHANDIRGPEFERLRRAWSRGPRQSSWDVDHAWTSVAARIDDAPAVTAPRPRASWRHSAMLRVAAVLVVAIGIAYVWRPWQPSPLTQTQVHATAAGVRSDVELLDGTRVTLGPASELRVIAGYGGTQRRVELTGEAWFEVRHDARRPFEVYAGRTITRDLGTSFSVRALPGDSVVQVVMIEGSASLRHSDLGLADGVTLRANDVGVMRAAARVATVRSGASVDRLVSWRTGTLDFDDAALRDIAIELTRWYAVLVRFSDSATAARRYSGPMPTNDLPEAQRALEAALGVRIARIGDTLVVR